MLVTAPDTDTGRAALLTASGMATFPPVEPQTVRQAYADHRTISHGPLTLDVDRRDATWHNRVLPLPARSFDLLVTLAEDPGRTWSFADLTVRVWRRDYLGDTDAVISAVKRLRRHIAGRAPGLHVESVRGVGFRLVDLRRNMAVTVPGPENTSPEPAAC